MSHLTINTIHHRDCVAGMGQLAPGSIDLAFADPPFNIGYEYDVYEDEREHAQYLKWSREWISAVHTALKPTGTFWLAIGDEYAAELKLISQEIGFHCRSWVVWYYTFGVNCAFKFSRSHAHLFYFVKDPRHFTFRFEDLANRIPSARQLVYGDRRANPNGRLPDDTWVLRPQDLAGCFSSEEDTWYFPRVAGTFKERAGFHGCQMPEQLLGRIIRFCSEEGEVVLDPFAGSATTLVVAKKLGRQFVGFDLSPDYVERGRKRLEQAQSGAPLEGAPEPTMSAPSTAEGRRLGEPKSTVRLKSTRGRSAPPTDSPTPVPSAKPARVRTPNQPASSATSASPSVTSPVSSGSKQVAARSPSAETSTVADTKPVASDTPKKRGRPRKNAIPPSAVAPKTRGRQRKTPAPLEIPASPKEPPPVSAAPKKRGRPPAASKSSPAPAADVSPAKPRRGAFTLEVDGQLLDAFRATHEGYSLDRLVADPELQAAFVRECERRKLPGDAYRWFHRLLNLRKRGRLADIACNRRTALSWEDCDSYSFASEIALTKLLGEGHESLDEILCDPAIAARFDQLAAEFAPGFTSFQYRWAALKLRKEAKVARSRAANVTAPVLSKPQSIAELADKPAPAEPGVYLVKDAAGKTLYVGESLNLRERLQRQFELKDANVRRAWQTFGNLEEFSVVTFVTPKRSSQLLAYQSHLVGRLSPQLNYRELAAPSSAG